MAFSFGTKPAFGAPAAGTSTGFGAAQPAPATGFAFGTPAATAPSFFGTPASQPSTGLAFGTPAQATGGLSFGTPAASTGLSFGTPAPTAATGLSFGTAPAAATTGLSFGTPAGAPSVGGLGTGFGFGASSSAPAFGAATTTTTSTGLAFGAPATIPSMFLTATPAFSTAAAPASSAAPVSGLNFGATPSVPTLNFGLGGMTTVTSTAQPQTSVMGLGGVAAATPAQSVAAKSDQVPKDQPLPNEIQQTVDSFKSFVKEQKIYSSDVARCSVKEFKSVESDIERINDILTEVEKQLQVNKSVADKLKHDTAKGLKQIEMAQRTFDTPIGLQFENTAPLEFFIELADSFEKEMQYMKLQIETTDKYVQNFGKTTPLNSQDLALGMRRIHETFVALAGRIQTVHSQVEAQKEQYLMFRRNVLNDNTNVFEEPLKQTHALNAALNSINQQSSKVLQASGPTPFNNMTHPSVVQAAAAQNSAVSNTMPSNTFAGFGGNATSAFGNSSLFGSFGQTSIISNTNSSFQLQKPPNKRGKQ